MRTALSLAAITGCGFRIHNIRSGRRKPGLAAQHLTAVRAVAKLCDAETHGDDLGSQELDFVPRKRVCSGEYVFDVAQARKGGSAGSTTLILQAVLLPLALCKGESGIVLRGGTHLPSSPSFDYIHAVWLPVLARFGVRSSATLDAWGWFPAGGGQIRVTISGLADGMRPLKALRLVDRGPLRRISGRAIGAALPSHIPQRIRDRARTLLEQLGTNIEIDAQCVDSLSPGAGLFLVAEYQNIACGFTAMGARGKPSEEVGEEAAGLLLEHWRSGAALDIHLGDQIILPAALCAGPSTFSVEKVTRHMRTNAWVIAQFGIARTSFDESALGATITLVPT